MNQEVILILWILIRLFIVSTNYGLFYCLSVAIIA